MRIFKENHMWILTALETIILGLGLSNPQPYFRLIKTDPAWISFIHTPIFTFTMVLIGIACLALSFTPLTKTKYSLNVFLLSLVWIFMSIVFIVHDHNDPNTSLVYPHVDTLLSTFVALRIVLEAWFGTKYYDRYH